MTQWEEEGMYPAAKVKTYKTFLTWQKDKNSYAKLSLCGKKIKPDKQNFHHMAKRGKLNIKLT